MLFVDFPMNQLEEGSCVLGGMESGEKITGEEREKRLKHVNVGSSQSSSVAWDATTQRSQVQKKVSRLQGDRDQTHFDFSCKFHTTCLGFSLFPSWIFVCCNYSTRTRWR